MLLITLIMGLALSSLHQNGRFTKEPVGLSRWEAFRAQHSIFMDSNYPIIDSQGLYFLSPAGC